MSIVIGGVAEALVCTATGGCETVQQSEYATLAGVPVALLGLLAYAAVLVLTIVDTPLARTLTVAIALSAAGFAALLQQPSAAHVTPHSASASATGSASDGIRSERACSALSPSA